MNWWSRFLDFISPRQCAICGRRLMPTEHSICSVCLLHLPRTNYQLTPYNSKMAQLFWHLAQIERAAAFYYHEAHSETASLIYKLKYNNRPDIGEDIGRVMANEMAVAKYFDGIDALVPVPLSRKRMRQRGYNQSEQIARGISAVTLLPVITKALCRKNFTKSQTALNRQQRQENVAETFELRDGNLLRNKHVLLIDDVCTTGATLIACANAIKNIEGIRISVLTLSFRKS